MVVEAIGSRMQWGRGGPYGGRASRAFVMLAYVLNFLDRVNVGYAALT